MSAAIFETDLILRPDGSVYHLGLQPEEVPDLILTVGDPERVPLVSQYFDRIDLRRSHREFCAHVGWVGSQRLMVISSGMGTDNVEILLTELDALVNVDLRTRIAKTDHRQLTIVRIGTSGSLQADVPVDSYVVNQYAFGLDTLMQFYPLHMPTNQDRWSVQLRDHLGLEFTPYCAASSQRLLTAWEGDCLIGTTVTCPGFYAPQGRKVRLAPYIDQLPEKLGRFRFDHQVLTNFEMETAGYYALGHLLGHEMLSINAILANRVSRRFSDNPTKTTVNLIRKVVERVETIL